MRPVLAYDYAVTEVIRVVDGDTVDLRIDLGFYLSAALRFRLLGVDTPELRGAEREAGLISKAFVQGWLEGALQLRVRTEKGDSFGRWLGIVYDAATQESLSEAIVREGYGTPVEPF